ncbi:DUF1585 domain-containing protein [Pseudobacteriovorax antillogorgiicola]|uniref:Cytochrome c domain-containing protein n=1 Tax=Pseudobacteriovorax antillogorgiicola TaxID=1513793 RepID=A0A1Y6CQN9_9BACT|nr:DUF1585 domain-containing protein [Pseudobacteriovorax antillogorgiicola]TCS46394.1 uncharacterized protein DUF1585 [Pseudobacteriovorax antillogorgiicola]SMF68730.1 Protein of unknown function [Pseudobacteriovorax antillogorgiicola]
MLKVLRFLLSTSFVVASGSVYATTEATDLFCQKYPKATACADKPTSCGVCHAGPPSLNDFGQNIKMELDGTITESLLVALDKLEDGDSDQDGATNIDEILNGGEPGNKSVQPAGEINVEYDIALAYKRMKSVFCGTSASYQDMKQLEAEGATFLHNELTQCLEGAYWKDEALHRIADAKIQPLATIGYGGNVVIGDYRWDYWLYSYVMTGDRDARELLSATYHIDGRTGEKIEGNVRREEGATLGERIVIAGGQPLAANRRAGMMTTQWFISNFTMFAELPRNTASQVYRAYLGLDIAKGEGLTPVPGEPRDVDNKNIAQPACAVCHSTLDPLAYAYSTYNGIDPVNAFLFNSIGTYNAGRQPWESDGAIFGQPVNDLLEWAEVARNSDAFKKNLVKDIFHYALSRDPFAHEADEFKALWEGLPEDAYSVNKMIHKFVDTKAFGGRVVK